jgi:hypothetical protein
MRGLLQRVAADFAPKFETYERDIAAIDRKLTALTTKTPPQIDGHTREISQLRNEISRLKEENSTTERRQMLLEQQLGAQSLGLPAPRPAPAPPPAASARIDSLIMPSIPLILNELAGKR